MSKSSLKGQVTLTHDNVPDLLYFDWILELIQSHTELEHIFQMKH